MAVLSEHENRLRQVLRLVDLSGDLERNQEDSEFRESGGEIIYVLDENIFEMFVRPRRHRESVETFYADDWASNSRTLSEYRSYEAQAALVASEFLVSRKLPGSSSDHILMTAQHRWELAHRVEALIEELTRELRADPGAVGRQLQKKVAILAALTDSGTIRVSRAVDPALSRDLRDLELAGAAAETIERVRRARVAAPALTQDELTEPLDQVRRITKPPIRGRLRTLQAIHPATGRDLNDIAADAEFWFERLAGELSRPGHKNRARARSRDDLGRALMNDAESIAYARWVARCLNPNQRLVFVTGDPVMFDAYRRWHTEPGPARLSSGEPFFMRRATQYSPIFNPHDSGGDLHQPGATGRQTSVLFSLIQQAVEAALLPVSFAAGTDSLLNLSREQLALKMVDAERLSDDADLRKLAQALADTWLADHADRVEQIRDQWQKAQRLAIGSSYDLIVERITDEQLTLAAVLTRNPDHSDQVLGAYVAELLDRLVEDSLQLWLPLAETFDEGRPDSPAPERLAVILDFDGLQESGDGPRAEQVFAEAACRALSLEDISNADRFASLALRADEAAAARELATSGVDLELRYLNAVTQRYQIATLIDHFRVGRAEERIAAQRSINKVKLLYARASRLIHECLAAHFPGDEGAPNGGDMIRYLRALSERAALNLFAAASLGLARSQDESERDAQACLHIARGDLSRCLRWERRLRGENKMFLAVRSQMLWNVAAAEVLRYLLTSETYVFDAQLSHYVRRVREHAETHQDAHPLLRAECEAFLHLADAKPLPRATIRPASFEMRLPMDRELYRRMAAEGLLGR
jgi:hypothetical protein